MINLCRARQNHPKPDIGATGRAGALEDPATGVPIARLAVAISQLLAHDEIGILDHRALDLKPARRQNLDSIAAGYRHDPEFQVSGMEDRGMAGSVTLATLIL